KRNDCGWWRTGSTRSMAGWSASPPRASTTTTESPSPNEFVPSSLNLTTTQDSTRSSNRDEERSDLWPQESLSWFPKGPPGDWMSARGRKDLRDRSDRQGLRAPRGLQERRERPDPRGLRG